MPKYEEFQIGSAKLRLQKLPALVMAREHGALIQRADHGALDMLAFQLTPSDQDAILSADASAIFILLKTLASVLGMDDLANLCVHYLKVGVVEISIETKADTRWVPLAEPENLELLDSPGDIYVAVWKVIRELLDPLAKLLPASTEGATERDDGGTFSILSETTSQPAPTSETPSSS